MDRIDNQLITEQKSALLREQPYGAKEKADTNGKDLLTLLVRATLQDADGMSNSDVPPFLITVSHRDLYLPHRWPRNDEYRHVLDLVSAVTKSGSAKEATERAFGSRHR